MNSRALSELDDGTFNLPAAWFYSGSGEPLQNVAIDVTDGVITDIHQLSAAPDSRLIVIPPLVNAHTHLELSDCAKPIAGGANFPEWIRAVIAHRAARQQPIAAIRAGLKEVATSGTATVADTVPAGLPTSSAPGVRSFIEYIGMTDERVDAAISHAVALIDRNDSRTIGISPHAPYSVRIDLLDQLIGVARESGLPMMMHLGETLEELQLLRDGTGPFAEMLQSFGIWDAGLFPSLSMCDYIDRLTQVPRSLFAHGNYFGDAELDLLTAKPNATVVFCPRTHAHFGHAPHPWRQMLGRGINVALGTDSRASNPDLSVWNEALFLRRLDPGTSAPTLLRMLTGNGCRGIHGEPLPLRVNAQATLSVLNSGQLLTDFWSIFDKAIPIAACVAGSWQ